MKKYLMILNLLLLLLFFSSCNNGTNSNNGKSDTSTAQTQMLPLPELNSIFINGDSIQYMDIGNGDPVIFVHGTLGDYRIWAAQMDTFAKDHRVIAYSRRYAYPNKQVINDSADYSVIQHTKDLAAFIKALNLPPVHLVGHSYGAFVTLLVAMDHPELVRSLTLGEPPVMSMLKNAPGGDSILNNFITKALTPTSEAFKNNNNEKAVTAFIAGVLGDSLFFSRLPQQARNNMMDNTLELRGSVFSKNLFPTITCDTLNKIKAPVLLVKGDRSPVFFTAIIDELGRCLNRKELATLPNSSHGLEFENPVEFNKLVLRFIDKH